MCLDISVENGTNDRARFRNFQNKLNKRAARQKMLSGETEFPRVLLVFLRSSFADSGLRLTGY